MIKNSKRNTGLAAIVICDNCKSISMPITEKNLIDYERYWLSGMTYDVCPDCQETELNPEISMKISAERKVLENYQIKRAALNNLKG